MSRSCRPSRWCQTCGKGPYLEREDGQVRGHLIPDVLGRRFAKDLRCPGGYSQDDLWHEVATDAQVEAFRAKKTATEREAEDFSKWDDELAEAGT